MNKDVSLDVINHSIQSGVLNAMPGAFLFIVRTPMTSCMPMTVSSPCWAMAAWKR